MSARDDGQWWESAAEFDARSAADPSDFDPPDPDPSPLTPAQRQRLAVAQADAMVKLAQTMDPWST